MRIVKRSLITLFILVIFALTGGYFIAKSRVPAYSGVQTIAGLADSVLVHFDAHGIPHIEGKNAADTYFALGYIMASERLFQMEMIRRLGKGQLAEVIGEKALSSDVFFRTIGIGRHARQSADDFMKSGEPEAVAECTAFLEGINAFVHTGKRPLEFMLASIPMREFEPDDLFTLAGYMAWSFSLAVQTDLLASELAERHGTEWLEHTGLDEPELLSQHPVCNPSESDIISTFPDYMGELGIPAFSGSNAWAVAPSKSASGKAILCNDTHIGYGIPQVWYEACIAYPGFVLYGNFLPGIPYALVGHSATHAWGLTMFENDDIDFFYETTDDSGLIVFNLGHYAADSLAERIAVKGMADTVISVVNTRHGVVMNDAVSTLTSEPLVAMHWEYLRGRNRLLQAFRSMNRARTLDRFAKGLELIHAPGLNVVYADMADNIGWWAAARLPIRPEGVHPKLPSDGSMSGNAHLGYLPFDRNPQCVNPEIGFVYSANERPEPVDDLFVPGYYVPPTRGERISTLLEAEQRWDQEKMKRLLLDVVNTHDAEISALLAPELQLRFGSDPTMSPYVSLFSWNGRYAIEEVTPVLYQPLQVALMHQALSNYMSQVQFQRLITTHWFRRWMIIALLDHDHMIWDIPGTIEHERLPDHLEKVFPEVVASVVSVHGKDTSKWQWGNAHRYAPKHPFNDVPLIGRWLSASPLPMAGSNETISQAGFTPSLSSISEVRYGAQMRIVIDFNDIDASESIAPVGQSGHRLSQHYADQLPDYVAGRYRAQRLTPRAGERKLVLLPK